MARHGENERGGGTKAASERGGGAEFFELRAPGGVLGFSLPPDAADLRSGEASGLVGLGVPNWRRWGDPTFFRLLGELDLPRGYAVLASARGDALVLEGSAPAHDGGARLAVYGHETSSDAGEGACDSVILAPLDLAPVSQSRSLALGAVAEAAWKAALLAVGVNLYSTPSVFLVPLGVSPDRKALVDLVSCGQAAAARLFGLGAAGPRLFRHELLIRAAASGSPGTVEWVQAAGGPFDLRARQAAFLTACALNYPEAARQAAGEAGFLTEAAFLAKAASAAARGAAGRAFFWLASLPPLAARIGADRDFVAGLLEDACSGGAPDDRAAQTIARHLINTAGGLERLPGKSADRALVAAARAGHTSIIRTLVARARGASEPGGAPAALEGILAACEAGHLSVAALLLPFVRRPETPGASGVSGAAGAAGAAAIKSFAAVCANGNLAAAQWLAAAFDLKPGDVRRTALVAACSTGSLGVAKWLVSDFGLGGADAVTSVLAALRRGDAPTAQWLVTGLQAPPPETTAEVRRSVFEGACLRGTFAAQLAAQTMGASPGELVPEARASFVLGKTGGRVDTAAWLAGALGLGRGDFRAFVPAVWAEGFLAIAKWLLVTYDDAAGLATEAELGEALRLAAERGQHETLGWLADNFEVSEAAASRALSAACGGGHLETAEAVLREFPEARPEAASLGGGVEGSLLRGDVEFAEWARLRFGPTEVSSALLARLEQAGLFDSAAWVKERRQQQQLAGPRT